MRPAATRLDQESHIELPEDFRLVRNRCRDNGVVQQPPLAQQTFFQLLHIMDLRTVDPLLKDAPDALVHRIQIWQLRWPHIWRYKLLASLCAER